MLIYGPTKIGKSTWCSYAENALFLSTEPGLNRIVVEDPAPEDDSLAPF